MKKTTKVLSYVTGVLLFAFSAYAGEITIGTGTNGSSRPLSTGFHDARTQTIYLASEIGGAKTLDRLSLNVGTKPELMMNNFTIRLKHTDLSSYGSNPVWESTGWTTVYQTNQTISTTGWVAFVFTTPFMYNGAQNLIVDISFNNSTSTTSGYCYYTPAAANRSISYRTNSSYGDPLTWSDSTPAFYVSTACSNIKLGFDNLIDNLYVLFSLDGGTYNTEQNVVVTCPTAGATIHYTTNGLDPTESDPVIASGSGIVINHSLTLKARAWKEGFDPSDIKSVTYQIIVATPEFTPDGTAYVTEPNVVITCATPGATIHYTTNGLDPNEIDAVIASGDSITVSVDPPTILKAKAWKGNLDPSDIKSATYQTGPFQIATKAQLLAMAANVNNYDKHCILTADIDMSGQVFNTAVIAPDTNSSYDFQGTAFTGTFDGNGHKIMNLTINGGDNDYLGLFGYIGTGGQIKNLSLENFSVVGTSSDSIYNGGLAGYNHYGRINGCTMMSGTVSGQVYTGGLVGCNDTGNVDNCSVTGTISNQSDAGGLIGRNLYGVVTHCHSTCTINGHSTSGGLIGTNEGGNISNCYSISSVAGTNDTGGLVGFNRGSIIECYTEGSIINTGDFKYALGGLVGYNRGSISRCYSTCFTSVSNSSSAVGGLVGNTSVGGSITDCYSVGAVNGISAVGGLVGDVGNGGIVSNCYSVGPVNGSSDIGGLVGEYHDGTVTSSFWDMETCGRTASAAGTGKTTAQMKSLSTFISEPNNWDFSTTWTICEGSNYPKLRWQIPGPDWACPDGVNIEDLDYFVNQWLNDCNTSNNYCSGVDTDSSGQVDLADFIILAENQRSGDPSSHVWIPGRTANSLSFDGVNDYIVVPGYYGIGGTNARTVSLWVNTSVIRDHDLVQWGSDATGQLWLIRIQANGTLLVSVSNGGVYSTNNIIDGQWHHITAVLDQGQTSSGQIRLYIDGVLDAVPQSATCTINTAQTVPVHLGTWNLYSTGQFDNYYSGLMDDVRIYNRALAENEIDPNTLSDTGLVTHWTMDEVIGTVAHDSVSSYDGTLTGY